ncbi:MAG: EFR1 family ferrodoxin [Treponema sp.]|nr:EFR1 family ferrodoxin [Treponema sp.]
MLMLYFSGTGNSKYVAELFCSMMNMHADQTANADMSAHCYSIEENINIEQMISLHETVGFCYPIYGSRVPRIMREFVRKYIELFKDKKIIIFCTQWIFSGDGARVFTDIFPRNYLEVVYAEHFLMPNNVNNLFILPIESGKKIKKYLVNAERKMQIVCNNIRNGIIKKRGFNGFSCFLGLFQGVFMPMWEKKALNLVMVYDNCISSKTSGAQCGVCVSICPMRNFENQNGIIVTKGNCTICYRCINKCPQKAIAVFLKSKPKVQYKGINNLY